MSGLESLGKYSVSGERSALSPATIMSDVTHPTLIPWHIVKIKGKASFSFMKIRAKKVTTLTDYHFKDDRPNSFPVRKSA